MLIKLGIIRLAVHVVDVFLLLLLEIMILHIFTPRFPCLNESASLSLRVNVFLHTSERTDGHISAYSYRDDPPTREVMLQALELFYSCDDIRSGTLSPRTLSPRSMSELSMSEYV